MPTIIYCHRCVFSPRCCCGCWSTLLWVSTNTRTHTLPLSLSLCLSAILLSSPFFPFDIKTLATTSSLSIEIQISPYSLVLISKVTSIRNHGHRATVLPPVSMAIISKRETQMKKEIQRKRERKRKNEEREWPKGSQRERDREREKLP